MKRVIPTTVAEALANAPELAVEAPLPGSGRTGELWQLLTTIAATDLGAARAIEPHLDAIAILHEAGADDLRTIGSTWGVFAAEGGEPLRFANGVLDGTKQWCSLADRLDAALVTATLENGDRQLFAVDLRHAGIGVIEGAWHSRGLSEVPSGPVRFAAVPATPVGGSGWYLSRPGFTWGGIGVAACWYGGAIGIARTVYANAVNDFALAHLGAIDELLSCCRLALDDAAALVDSGEANSITAKRVRATVARAAEEIIARAGHALGPAPLALDAPHAKRVADLGIYIRQHHAEKDQASLGRALLDLEGAPW